MKKSTRGFTIVELLIVVVVIAILAAITIIAYNGIQDRAKYSKTVSAINAISKAFQLKAIADGKYQSDSYYSTCIGQPLANQYIDDIVKLCKDSNPLSNYVKADAYLVEDVPLVYDNDDDIYPSPCTGFSDRGVNLLFAFNVTDAALLKLDNDYDNNNGLNCGKVRKNSSSGQQYYMLSTQSSLY